MRRPSPIPLSVPAPGLLLLSVVAMLSSSRAGGAAASTGGTSCGGLSVTGMGLVTTQCPAGQFCLYKTLGSCGTTSSDPAAPAATGFLAALASTASSSKGPGVCSPFPEVCPTIYEPVCGCDGLTYPSDCMAHSAGISIKSTGECGGGSSSSGSGSMVTAQQILDGLPKTTTTPTKDAKATTIGISCLGSSGCSSSQWCHFQSPKGEDACPASLLTAMAFTANNNQQLPQVSGVCVDKPDVCPTMVQAPVCGCNGKRYSSLCEAHRAGVNAAPETTGTSRCTTTSTTPAPSPTTTKTSCGGFRGAGCPDGMYCNYIDSSCGAADKTGVCDPMPGSCSTSTNKEALPQLPVCGCDGKTYQNQCLAAVAGVSVSSQGACPVAIPTTCGGKRVDSACSQKGAYCKYALGVCGRYDQQGMCDLVPSVCYQAVVPVCGCDGTTYINECFARQAGTSVASMGECPTLDNNNSQQQQQQQQQQDTAAAAAAQLVPGAAAAASAATTATLSAASSPLSSASFQLMAESGSGNSTCGHGKGDCASGYYCVYPEGVCGSATGVCLSVPSACTTFAPLGQVCGCNGLTYGSECEAGASKVSIKSSFQSCEALMAADNSKDVHSSTSPAPSGATTRGPMTMMMMLLTTLVVAVVLGGFAWQ